MVKWTSCVVTADSPAIDLQPCYYIDKLVLSSLALETDLTHFSVYRFLFNLSHPYCQSGVLLSNFSRDLMIFSGVKLAGHLLPSILLKIEIVFPSQSLLLLSLNSCLLKNLVASIATVMAVVSKKNHPVT